MSKKKKGPDIIAEETTTLPEGARVSVYKQRTVYKRGHVAVTTYLLAYHEDKKVRMLIEEDISAPSLKTYLILAVKEIARRRLLLTQKPEWLPNRGPKTMEEFVLVMAHNGMFMLDDLTTTEKVLSGSK